MGKINEVFAQEAKNIVNGEFNKANIPTMISLVLVGINDRIPEPYSLDPTLLGLLLCGVSYLVTRNISNKPYSGGLN